ncbi:MAG: GAF domain-containing protein [Anaerolineae bacterium]|nr:GAF domain-containing protein [Anaerolineae bacterium]
MNNDTPLVNPIDNKLFGFARIVGEMSQMLKAQRDLLSQRNIMLSTDPIEQLQLVSQSVTTLSTFVNDDQVEVQQLRELARITEVVSSSLDVSQVLNHVIDTVILLTKAERGYIVLKNPDTGELEFRVARNVQQHDLNRDEFTVSRTVVERVAQSGQPIVSTNAELDERFQNSESIANYMLRSILCVPLKRKNEVKGVIYADNRMRPGVFSEREQRLVYAFANQATIALENARLYENLIGSVRQATSIKDFMDNVFASIASGVIATDRNDTITTINELATRILGIPMEQALGRSLWEVLPDLYAGFDELFRQVREQNRQEVIEVDPVIEGRGQVSLILKLSPLKDEQEITRGVTIVMDDLTELKQRQAQLSAVRRYLPAAMVDNIRTIDELQLGGVERKITMLYCDVRGFSTFSEGLPPDELMTVINKYLTISSEAITLQEGIIDKYMGDAVMGLYNTQLNPQEDHAVRAVRSALAMLSDVQDLHELVEEKQRLFYGIGVHTGSAILGNMGSPRRKEFTVIGDALRISKLLQENALGGEVIISQSTYDDVKHVFSAERVDPRKAKDEGALPTMYRVTGVLPN